jgi:phospholipase C
MSPGLTPERARTNLDKVEHVIVLMMENRSFDHMLGYLKLEGIRPEVDGLEAHMGNEDARGRFRRVRPLGKRRIDHKVLDPGHGPDDIEEQLADDMGGFVRNYVRAFERRRKEYELPRGFKFDPTLVLSYQTGADVPVYDYLARNFHVCDRWFSSVPGSTWPNRLYAATGGSDGTLENRKPPIYELESFLRHLDAEDVPWRWYSFDPGTLRGIDARYQLGHDREFAYFNRKSLFERQTFLDDAKDGKLPSVAWIDPNFVDFRLYGPPGSNDDHPPADVMPGQELVLTLVSALMASPQWKKSLLVITYDEHGGFFDHVDPRGFQPEDDRERFRRYGVRVPALVVSPYVEPGVSHTVFDHTSIIKTILLRFCDRAEAAIQRMGKRVAHANHLGWLLTRAASRPRPPAPERDIGKLVAKVAAWRRAAYKAAILEEPTPGETLFEALTDLQGEIVSAALRLRARGLQPGAP